VDSRRSMAERLERDIRCVRSEIFRFGVSGAPLSQYLHILRREAAACSPDLVIFLLAHNDFRESFAFAPGTLESSFLKLDLSDPSRVSEVEPTGLRAEPLLGLARASATWRWLAYTQKVRFQTLRDLFLGRAERFQANVDPEAAAAAYVDIQRATTYAFQELRRLADEHGFTPLLVMDGVRTLIHQQSPEAEDYSRWPLRLNALAAELARAERVPFLDLHPVFLRDYETRKEPLLFRNDGHWTEHAHAVAAAAVAEFVCRQGLLAEPRAGNVDSAGETYRLRLPQPE